MFETKLSLTSRKCDMGSKTCVGIERNTTKRIVKGQLVNASPNDIFTGAIITVRICEYPCLRSVSLIF